MNKFYLRGDDFLNGLSQKIMIFCPIDVSNSLNEVEMGKKEAEKEIGQITCKTFSEFRLFWQQTPLNFCIPKECLRMIGILFYFILFFLFYFIFFIFLGHS